MTEYSTTVEWERGGAKFTDNRYSRAHVWKFDGGAVVPGSSAPTSVPLPYSAAENVDPEEALVAALSSCHMLWFLWIAAQRGYRVDRYLDDAVGCAGRNEVGKEFMELVTLRPSVSFSGTKEPDDAAVAEMHHAAHEECFVANSFRGVVETAGSWTYEAGE